MLHWGSMRWTVGSSMYSKARLPGVRPRSTRKVTGTEPAPLTDGAEKHTISEVVLLEGEEMKRNAITHSRGGVGGVLERLHGFDGQTDRQTR